MAAGRHSRGKPRQPGVLAYALMALTAFTAGLLTAMYLPENQPPLMAASSTAGAQRDPNPGAGPDGFAPPAPDGAAQGTSVASSSSEAAQSSAEAAASSSDSSAPQTITVLGVGDILVHKEIWAQAVEDAGGDETGDFTQMLEGVRSRVQAADLGICHMEYPFTTENGQVTYWPARPAAPWSLATGVQSVGFDACSTVSNHMQDQGAAGITNALDALDRAGIVHYGAARTQDEAGRITTIQVKGATIALLAYSYGLYENGDSWMVNSNDIDRIVADAQRARDEGAQIVIVSLHDGEENVTEPDESQLSIAQTLADAGTVDLIIGHHTHCVQPVQKLGDMWVAYGHGNLLTAQSRKDMRTADGLVTQWTFAPDESGRWRIVDAAGIAILGTVWPYRIADVSAAGSARDEWEQASWQRTYDAVMSKGADQSGFHLL